MKRLLLQFICLTLLFIGNLGLLGALEIELLGGANGLSYHPDRLRAHTEIDTVKEFSQYPFGLGLFSIRGDIGDVMGFSVNIERDNIFQNSINARLSARTDYLKVDFGPYVGITDSFDMPDLGIIGCVELTLPGVIFLSLSGLSTLGTQFDFTSENYRELLEAKFGVWLPKAIISASASTKNLTRFTEDTASTLSRQDSLTRYTLGIIAFSKGSPTTAVFEGGYQIYSRTYARGAGRWEYIDEIKSYFGGIELQREVSHSLKIKIGAEVPFLITPKSPMTVTKEFWYLSKLTAGFNYTFHGNNE